MDTIEKIGVILIAIGLYGLCMPVIIKATYLMWMDLFKLFGGM